MIPQRNLYHKKSPSGKQQVSVAVPLQILGVDPSSIFLTGLEKCLRDFGDIRIVYARDQTEALRAGQTCNFHLICLGHGLHEIEAFEVCRFFRARHPESGIVMLSLQAQDDWFQVDALASGANICLNVETPLRSFVDDLQLVLQRRVVFAPTTVQMLRMQEQLTVRESEVLREMALGKSDREIAKVLSVGLCTVKTHVANILSKLHLSRRQNAITRARRNGWIQ